MTDRAWAEGMAEFQRVGMPGWPYDDPAVSMDRAQAYRKHLDGLTDFQWCAAVNHAIAACKWFPTVHELLEFGEAAVPKLPMLPPARTAQERERDQETAKRGLELIRQEAVKVGLVLPKRGPTLVLADDAAKKRVRDLAERVVEAVTEEV